MPYKTKLHIHNTLDEYMHDRAYRYVICMQNKGEYNNSAAELGKNSGMYKCARFREAKNCAI